MLNEARHANCIAVDGPVRCLCLDQPRFALLLGGAVQDELVQRMRTRILQSVPLLAKLPEDQLTTLARPF